MTEPVTVDLVDVMPGAVKDRADTLAAGDSLYDAFGGTHEIRRVAVFKHVTRTIRTDGVWDYFENDSMVTRLPKAGA